MLFVATPEADQKEGVALDALGSHFLSIVKAQGLPAHIGVFQVHVVQACRSVANVANY